MKPRKMKLSMFLMIAAATTGSASAQKEGEPSGQWLAAAFKTLCYEPFGERAQVEKAVASFPEKTFVRVEGEPDGPEVGIAWETSTVSLNYTDAEWLPRNLPSPQCTLSSDEEEYDFNHTAVAQALQATLPIGEGKTKGNSQRQTTEWSFSGANNTKRRLFLTSGTGGRGFIVRVSLLNLRK